MIERGSDLAVTRQAQLLGLSRSSVYYTPRARSAGDLALMRRIDELHLQIPFYGSRKITRELRNEGHDVGRRHVVTLMRLMGIEAIYRKPRTSMPARDAQIRPYLLANLSIERPDQVWASDVTYLPMAHGFMYLVVILDVYSRKVLAHRLSNTLTPDFCVEALQEALSKFGRPEIFNTDQGSQFTSEGWIDVLEKAGVAISMDGKGRWIDNVFIERLWRSVKYEEVVCYERTRAWTHRERCFTKDEGRSLEVSLQEQTSNHCKLRGLRALVVSVAGKGGAKLRQVGFVHSNHQGDRMVIER
jgi:putative transposase